MNSGRTIFSQIMYYLPAYEFRKCVEPQPITQIDLNITLISTLMNLTQALLPYSKLKEIKRQSL